MTAIQTETVAVPPPTTVEHVLTLDCSESPGIVHAVSGFLLERGVDPAKARTLAQQYFGDIPRGPVNNPAKADVPTEMWVDAATPLPVRWRLLQEGAERYELTGPLLPLAIPTTRTPSARASELTRIMPPVPSWKACLSALVTSSLTMIER